MDLCGQSRSEQSVTRETRQGDHGRLEESISELMRNTWLFSAEHIWRLLGPGRSKVGVCRV